MATDRELFLEQRIRQWLGEAQQEFDVVLVIWNQLAPGRFAMASAVTDGSIGDLETWKKLFDEWKVSRLLDVTVTVLRHSEACDPLDIRRLGAEGTHPAEIDWALRWERIAGMPQVHDALLHSRPVAAKGLQFCVTHVIEDEELRAANCRALVDYPFKVDIEIDRWMPLLLAACNGRRPGVELRELMCRQGHIPANSAPEKFAALLAAMVAHGFVVVPEFASPEPLRAAMAAAG
jgi:hypothetical protein